MSYVKSCYLLTIWTNRLRQVIISDSEIIQQQLSFKSIVQT